MTNVTHLHFNTSPRKIVYTVFTVCICNRPRLKTREEDGYTNKSLTATLVGYFSTQGATALERFCHDTNTYEHQEQDN